MMDGLYSLAVDEDLRGMWLVCTAVEVEAVIEEICSSTSCAIDNMKPVIREVDRPLIDLNIALLSFLVRSQIEQQKPPTLPISVTASFSANSLIVSPVAMSISRTLAS